MNFDSEVLDPAKGSDLDSFGVGVPLEDTRVPEASNLTFKLTTFLFTNRLIQVLIDESCIIPARLDVSAGADD